MHDLEAATRKAIAEQREMDDQIATLKATIDGLSRDIAHRDGQISKLEDYIRNVEADRDYYKRWAIETTKTIFDIGVFVNETINACRGVVGPNLQTTIDPKRNEAILKGVEAEILKRPQKPSVITRGDTTTIKGFPRDLDEDRDRIREEYDGRRVAE